MNIFTLQFISSSFYFGKSHTIVLIFMKAFLHQKKAVATDNVTAILLQNLDENIDIDHKKYGLGVWKISQYLQYGKQRITVWSVIAVLRKNPKIIYPS